MRFGVTGFNYPYDYDQFAQVKADGVGGLIANAAFSVTVSIQADGVGGVIARAAYTINESVGVMASSGELTARAGRKESATLAMPGIGAIVINNESASITTIQFVGTIPPGSQILIDTGKFIVTKDGLNALPSFSGEFVPLNAGINEIIYEDSEASRTVEMTVPDSERFI